MMTNRDREDATADAAHFDTQLKSYNRQRAECAVILARDKHGATDDGKLAANCALAIDDEYIRLRKAINSRDTSYVFPEIRTPEQARAVLGNPPPYRQPKPTPAFDPKDHERKVRQQASQLSSGDDWWQR